jgi:diguanylate cyclase (GGDEF)-like protein/PAS domain S-box-containing protein
MMVLALAVIPLGHDQNGSALLLAAACGLTLAIVAMALLVRWHQEPPYLQALPPLASLVVVALRRAGGGGAVSGYDELVMLPVLWLALHGTTRQLALCLVGVAAVFMVPVLVIGGQSYPESEWRHLLFFLVISSLVGFPVQWLIQEVRARAAETRSILETAHEAFVSIDAAGRITEWNRQAEATFGWSREEAVGRSFAETIAPPQQREQLVSGFEEFLTTGKSPMIGRLVELTAVKRDGGEFAMEVSISSVETADGFVFHAFIHDITERKHREQVMARNSQEIKDLYDNAPCGYHSINADGTFVRINDTELSWLGYYRDEVVGKLKFSDMLTPESRMPFDLQFTAFKGGGEMYDTEFELIRKDGTTMPVLLSATAVRDADGNYLMSRSTLFDITDRKRIEREREQLLQKVEAMARTDELTGLPNRRAWDEELRRELARAMRNGRPLAVAMIDLDRFKEFNDERGHQVGDALLKEAAARWRMTLRVTDFIARYGGDEFVLVLADCPMGEAMAVIQRIRAAAPEGQTCSAGVAAWDGEESADMLVGRADAALYEAKRSGRDRVVAADTDADATVTAHPNA